MQDYATTWYFESDHRLRGQAARHRDFPRVGNQTILYLGAFPAMQISGM